MKELLCGEGINKAFKDLGIEAKQTYCGEVYEVWELSEDNYDKLLQKSDALKTGVDWFFDLFDHWQDDWGWWRYSPGSNIEDYPTRVFHIRGKDMIGYLNDHRFDSMFYEEPDESDELWYFTHEKLTEYICDEIGASTESNVCAVAMSLAKLNNISMGELFTIYEGVKNED